MKTIDYLKISESELMNIYNHHVSILGRAQKLRILEDFEYEFLTLLPLLQSDIISMRDFRIGCQSYFVS